MKKKKRGRRSPWARSIWLLWTWSLSVCARLIYFPVCVSALLLLHRYAHTALHLYVRVRCACVCAGKVISTHSFSCAVFASTNLSYIYFHPRSRCSSLDTPHSLMEMLTDAHTLYRERAYKHFLELLYFLLFACVLVLFFWERNWIFLHFRASHTGKTH